VSAFSDFKGLTVQDFDALWQLLVNHEDASLDLKKETFVDIMKTFCEDYNNRSVFEPEGEVDADETHFKLATPESASRQTTLNTFFEMFSADEKPSSDESRADAIQLFVAMLLVSSLSKKNRVQLLYSWFAFFDEDNIGLDKDDLLLPVKTIMNAIKICTNLQDLTDDEVHQIRDEICEEIDRSVQSRTPKKTTSTASDSGQKTEQSTKPRTYSERDIWLWAESSPIITSWLRLGDTSGSDDSDEEGSRTDEEEEEGPEHDDEIHNTVPERSARHVKEMDPDSVIGDDFFAGAAESGGDEFMAVKPYTGTVKSIHKQLKKKRQLNKQVKGKSEASAKNKTLTDSNGMQVDSVKFAAEDFTDPGKHPTEARLKLEWVHGYRGSDCRNNVYFGKDANQAVYFTAAVGVKLTTNDETGETDGKKIGASQNFAFHHTDDVLSIAVCRNYKEEGILIYATGEIGKKPKICVWNPEGMTLLNTLKGFHSRGVNQLAFNKTGQYLLSLGVDDNHSLVVYDWKKNKMIHNSKSHKSKVFAIDFEHLLDDDKSTKMENFYSCGDKHILFWVKKGRGYVSKKGTFPKASEEKGKKRKKQPILMSVVSIRQETTYVYAGGTDGHIYCWDQGDSRTVTIENRRCVSVLKLATDNSKVHFGAVNVLKRLDRKDETSLLLAAGKNGYLSILTVKDKCLEQALILNVWENINNPAKFIHRQNGNKVFTALDKQIRAVDVFPKLDEKGNTRVLIGTRGSEIYDLTMEDKKEDNKEDIPNWDVSKVKCLMQGHSTAGSTNGAELWGLAIYPTQQEPPSRKTPTQNLTEDDPFSRTRMYATSGDDKRVRVWNIAGGMVKHHGLNAISDELDTMSRALAWSKTGKELAVGLGGRVGTRAVGTRSKHDGAVIILSYEKTKGSYEKTKGNKSSTELYPSGKLVEKRRLKPHPSDWISDIKYSLTGTLAVGAHDRTIYLYNSKTYEFRAKCKGMSSYVSHLDFSLDGEIVMSNDGSYELLFWNAKDGKQIKRAPADACWDTWTSTLGWPVQGIWPKGSDGTDINAVAFLPEETEDGRRKNIYSGILATADDFGKVKLFNSPCLADNASGVEYRGHSSHVTNIRFANKLRGDTKGDEVRLISVGGEDRSIFQWCYEKAEAHEEAGGMHNPDIQSDDEVHDLHQTTDEKAEDDLDTFEFGSGGGDEFMAVKPWLGNIKAPSNPPPADKSAPDADLELCVVHGYRAYDTRDNVHYAWKKDEEDKKDHYHVVYHAAALGIMATNPDPCYYGEGKEGNEKRCYEQQYNQDNTDDIKCLAVSEDGQFIATGEVGKTPKIVVWNVESCRLERTLSGFHKREVSIVAFSFDKEKNEAKYLASIGKDDNHSICIYNFKTGNMVANAKGDKNLVFALEFVKEKINDNITVVQCGVNHVRVWTMNGRNLSSKKIKTGDSICTCLSLTNCLIDSSMLIATADGTILRLCFDDKGKPKIDKNHTKTQEETQHGTINSIHSVQVKGEKKALVVTGCIEGIVRFWNYENGNLEALDDGKENLDDGKQNTVWRDEWKTRWDRFQKELKNEWNVMKTVYKKKQPKEKKKKKKSLKVIIPVDKASPQIRSVCLHPGGKKLLVGTRGAEIVEFEIEVDHDYKVGTPSVVTRGHFKDEVWGLAVGVTNFFVTTGDDGYVRVWNRKEGVQETCYRLGQLGLSAPVMARACALSSSSGESRLLAVGLGGIVGRGKTKHDGKLVILKLNKVVDKGKDISRRELEPMIGDIRKKSPPLHNAKGWISDLKFSPNSLDKTDGGYKGFLAAGSHDRNIYLYEANLSCDGKVGKVVMKHRLKGHNSYITHIDFSHDGKWMQSNCGAYELLFWDVKRGRRQPSAGAMRDVKWDTFTCTLGWPVQGIWPKCADGTDINAVDRNSTQTVLVTADDFGKLKLFRYPCLEPGAAFGQETGHSSHVTNVRWMSSKEGIAGKEEVIKDKYVVSTGGNDRCVFLWEQIIHHSDDETEEKDKDEHVGHHDEDLSNPFAAQMEQGGDESMATKPWKGQLVAPPNPDEARAGSPTKPRFKLEIGHVSGYQAQDPHSRGNLRFTAAGDIVYHTAAIGIVQKIQHDQNEKLEGPEIQRYFQGHDDDIICLTMDPTSRFVASGQTQSEHEKRTNPAVKIWDADSCREICTLGGFHKIAIACVAFSPDGKRVVSVGSDDNHSVALWETQSGTWEDGKSVASSRGDKSIVLFACFTPNKGKGVIFVTGGKNHISFWSLSGRSLKRKLGKRKGKRSPFTQYCATYVGNALNYRMVSGDAAGQLNVWKCNDDGIGKLTKLNNYDNAVFPKRKGNAAITSIAPCYGEDTVEEVKYIVTGSKDGEMHVLKWSEDGNLLEKYMHLNLAEAKPAPTVPEIRSVCIDLPLKKCLVGSKGSEIYICDIDVEGDKTSKPFKLLESGHNDDELWGLAVNPFVKDKTIVATSGDDKKVRVWEKDPKLGSLKLLTICHCDGMSRAVAWIDECTLVAGLGGRMGRTAIGKKKRRRTKSGGVDGGVDGKMNVFSIPDTSMAAPYAEHINAISPDTEYDFGKRNKKWISDIKFYQPKNSNQKYLAVSDHDSKVLIYMMKDSKKFWPCIGMCKKSPSSVTHIDFGQKGQDVYIRTNNLSLEVLRYSIKKDTNGKYKVKQETRLRDVRDVKWASNTCVMEWGTEGIWPQGAASDDINSVCTSPDNNVVVSADDHGHVNMFNYPCITSGASANVGKGHSSHVMNVRFSHGKGAKVKTENTNIFSVGGNDRALFMWKLKKV
jgi:microtubule-associated protein-like 6